MKQRHHLLLLIFGLVLGAVMLVGTLRPAPAAAAAAPNLYVLTDNNSVALLSTSSIIRPFNPLPVNGLAAGERLVAIDVRPQNNRLYALAVNGAGALQLYHLDLASGSAVATALNAAPVQFDDGSNPVPTPGESFGIDFNPTVDRLRLVSDGGLNARMNPNTGTLIDGDNGGAAGSAPGLNPDGSIKGPTSRVDDSAYTNSSINVAVTTQYTLDSATNQLFIQNPPNSGTQTMGRALTLDGTALDFSRVGGFDIPSSVAVSAAGMPATGIAYAVLTVSGVDGLYSIELSNGVAALLGTLGTAGVQDIALAGTPAAGISLSGDGTQLQRFLVTQPDATVLVPVTGLAPNDTLVGIDGRPATGQLFGVGVNATANTATIYRLDPQTGGATAIGTAGGIAFVDSAGAAVDLPVPSVGYGVDFNPTVDRIRLVTGNGLNARLNPITGAAVDGDNGGAAGSVPGVNPDGPISGATTKVDATAYTNNFQGVTGMVRTTQYTLDSASDQLFIQNPPNSGTQTTALPVTLNGGPLNFTASSGFDIAPDVVVATANTPAQGQGYAALSVNGVADLYSIDLATGVARRVGSIGSINNTTSGLVIWSAPPRATLYLALVSR